MPTHVDGFGRPVSPPRCLLSDALGHIAPIPSATCDTHPQPDVRRGRRSFKNSGDPAERDDPLPVGSLFRCLRSLCDRILRVKKRKSNSKSIQGANTSVTGMRDQHSSRERMRDSPSSVLSRYHHHMCDDEASSTCVFVFARDEPEKLARDRCLQKYGNLGFQRLCPVG